MLRAPCATAKPFCFPAYPKPERRPLRDLRHPDAELLTDEASYVRRVDGRYMAYGTPFAGEMGTPGKNISAPIAAVYLLHKAAENKIESVNPAEAIRRLMRNILFFAHDPELVRLVFESGLCLRGGRAGLSAFVFSRRAVSGT